MLTAAQQQQMDWLEEMFPAFEKIAQAIIVDSVTVSEEAVSNAMEIVLKSIERGNNARNRGQFAAYCRVIVRGCAMKTYSKYDGDVVVDRAARRAAWASRPDQRHTTVPNLDSFDGEHDPYIRRETLEPDDE
jgi:hypothetical protein